MAFSTQLRRIIAEYGLILTVLLAIIGVGLFANAGLTYTNPPTTTETYTTGEYEFGVGTETSAVVVNNSSLYTTGQRLHNMPVYFYSATPNLTYHIRTTIPADTQATLTKRLTLQLTATRNGEVFWEYTRVILANKTTVTDTVTWTNTTVNMSNVSETIREKRAAIGEIGTFSATHVLTVAYKTPNYQGELQTTATLITTGRAYWIDGNLNANKIHRETATRTQTGTPNTALVYLSSLAGFGCLVLAVTVFIRSRTYDLQELTEEIKRDQYSEWISNGEIPTKSEKEYIRVNSIEDAVDIAIDSNKRVIYDENLDVYAVVEGDIVYFYSTDDQDVTGWLDV